MTKSSHKKKPTGAKLPKARVMFYKILPGGIIEQNKDYTPAPSSQCPPRKPPSRR